MAVQWRMRMRKPSDHHPRRQAYMLPYSQAHCPKQPSIHWTSLVAQCLFVTLLHQYYNPMLCNYPKGILSSIICLYNNFFFFFSFSCTLNPHYTLHNPNCALHISQCTVSNAQCTLHTATNHQSSICIHAVAGSRLDIHCSALYSA